ncbi:hypothetical protein ColTof3_14719 [Colletotrichum tofieldiae]|nr:hypothetical protein ColTof3_14719 [Colletotrichum tofieldiae]
MRMRRRSSSRASGIFWNIPLTNAFTTAAGSDGDNLLPLTVGLFDKRSIDYNLQYKVIEVLVGEVLDSINPDKFQVMKRSLLYGHGETGERNTNSLGNDQWARDHDQASG